MKMQFLLLEQVQFLKVKDDSLLQWELVDVVDAEEEDDEEEWEQGDGDNIDGFGSWESSSNSSPNDNPIEVIGHFLPQFDADMEDHDVGDHGDDDGYDGGHGDDDDDDDVDGGDGDGDGYDLDDELVPWNVGNKFGRQRMRKLGKRAFSKMHNSKRSPYLFMRPGCVRGKHGLGLKHTY